MTLTFFKKIRESITEVLKHFRKLKEATGTTINLEKTTTFPINTNNTVNIPDEIIKNNTKP